MKQNKLETLLFMIVKMLFMIVVLSQVDYDDIINKFKTMVPQDRSLIL